MKLSELRARVDPSNWQTISNDGVNIVAKNTKTLELFSGTTADFNNILRTVLPKTADPDIEFDTNGQPINISIGSGVNITFGSGVNTPEVDPYAKYGMPMLKNVILSTIGPAGALLSVFNVNNQRILCVAKDTSAGNPVLLTLVDNKGSIQATWSFKDWHTALSGGPVLTVSSANDPFVVYDSVTDNIRIVVSDGVTAMVLVGRIVSDSIVVEPDATSTVTIPATPYPGFNAGGYNLVNGFDQINFDTCCFISDFNNNFYIVKVDMQTATFTASEAVFAAPDLGAFNYRDPTLKIYSDNIFIFATRNSTTTGNCMTAAVLSADTLAVVSRNALLTDPSWGSDYLQEPIISNDGTKLLVTGVAYKATGAYTSDQQWLAVYPITNGTIGTLLDQVFILPDVWKGDYDAKIIQFSDSYYVYSTRRLITDTAVSESVLIRFTLVEDQIAGIVIDTYTPTLTTRDDQRTFVHPGIGLVNIYSNAGIFAQIMEAGQPDPAFVPITTAEVTGRVSTRASLISVKDVVDISTHESRFIQPSAVIGTNGATYNAEDTGIYGRIYNFDSDTLSFTLEPEAIYKDLVHLLISPAAGTAPSLINFDFSLLGLSTLRTFMLALQGAGNVYLPQFDKGGCKEKFTLYNNDVGLAQLFNVTLLNGLAHQGAQSLKQISAIGLPKLYLPYMSAFRDAQDPGVQAAIALSNGDINIGATTLTSANIILPDSTFAEQFLGISDASTNNFIAIGIASPQVSMGTVSITYRNNQATNKSISFYGVQVDNIVQNQEVKFEYDFRRGTRRVL